MDTILIIANIFGIAAWVFLICSYYKENINDLLLMQIASSVLYLVNYSLLNAWAGLIITIFELIKGILFYKSDKDTLIYYCTLPVYLIIFFATGCSWMTLFAAFASAIDGFGVTRNSKCATICGMISNFMWCIYDGAFMAYTSALTDAFIVISNLRILIVGYSRLLKVDKFRIIKCHYLSKDICSTLYNLDKTNYGQDYTWNLDYQKKVFNKNKDSLLIVKYKKKIVGYINYLVVNYDTYEKIKKTRKLKNEYKLDELTSFKKRRKNYLIFDSINISKIYYNEKTVKIINSKIKRLIHQKYIQGYIISGIISIPFNKFETEVLEYMGFDKIKDIEKDLSIYELNTKKINDIYINKEFKSKLEDKKYKVVFGKDMTDEMFNGIATLDKLVFSEEYLWSLDYQKNVFNKNKDSFVAVLYNNELVGYLNYLCISEEKYNKTLESNVIIDEYNLDEICTFKKRRKNYITLNSIVINPKFQNGIVIIKLSKNFKKRIKDLKKSGYKIEGINATAVSKDGYKFATNFGFKEYKKLDDGNYLFTMK